VLNNAATLMIRRAAITVLVVAGITPLFARANAAMNSWQDQQPKAESKEKSDGKGASALLTGCIDEQNGSWVLVNNQTMSVIANLEADGFPAEAFAKYMGHKVNVRGTASSGEAKSKFKVREIKSISDTCTDR